MTKGRVALSTISFPCLSDHDNDVHRSQAVISVERREVTPDTNNFFGTKRKVTIKPSTKHLLAREQDNLMLSVAPFTSRYVM